MNVYSVLRILAVWTDNALKSRTAESRVVLSGLYDRHVDTSLRCLLRIPLKLRLRYTVKPTVRSVTLNLANFSEVAK